MEEFEQLYRAARNWRRALLLAVVGAAGSLAGVAIDSYFDYQSETMQSESQLNLEVQRLEAEERIAVCEQVFDYLEDEEPNPIAEGDLGRSMQESMEDAVSVCLGQSPRLRTPTGQ